MKKILAFVILLPLAMSLNSCKKSSTSAVTNGGTPNINAVANRTGTATMIWWVPFGYCAGEPKDCGPETVIVAKRPRLYSLQAAIDNGPSAIATFFSSQNNWDVFPPNYPSTQQMDKLASGNYDIIMIQSKYDDETYYFLCGPTQTLSAENPEFVVQGTYRD